MEARQGEKCRKGIPYGDRCRSRIVAAICECCGQEFEYEDNGTRQKYCFDCKRTGRYRRKTEKLRKVVPSALREVRCKFCGKTFKTRTDIQFCPHCVTERFSDVYLYKKANVKGWLSPGERMEKGLPAVSHMEDGKYWHWLNKGMTGPEGMKCGKEGEVEAVVVGTWY